LKINNKKSGTLLARHPANAATTVRAGFEKAATVFHKILQRKVSSDGEWSGRPPGPPLEIE
jgi:hypothetical protein